MEKFKNKINKYTSTIRTVVPVIIIFVLIFGFVLANCNVPSASMDPTMKAGSRVIASRLAYKNSDIKRKDVIVFKYPDNEDKTFTKRVVGLPGEVVTVVNGNTYINGKKLSEKYLINDHDGDYGPYYVPKAGDIVTIKDSITDENGNIISGNCFIGDYAVGTVEKEKQYDANGEIESSDDGFLDMYCEYKNGDYVVKADCFFCLGDNRNNSLDARFWSNHYVIKEKIIGKMILNVSAGFKKIE